MIKTEWNLDYFKINPTNNNDIIHNHYRIEVLLFMTKYENNVNTDDELLSLLIDLAKMGESYQRYCAFVNLNNALDTQNSFWLKEMEKNEQFEAKINDHLLFLGDIFKSFGYDRLIALSNGSKFNNFKNYLVKTANNIKYILTDKEEKVLLKLNTVFSNYIGLYNELTNSFEYEFNGNQLNKSEIAALRLSENRDDRKIAFNSINTVFNEKTNQITLSNIYSAICKENVANMNIRKYNTVMEAMNISEELSNNTVNELINVVQTNYPIYHDYLKIKKQILQLDKMEYYDIYAPYPSNKATYISFEDGWGEYCNIIKNVDTKLLDFCKDMVNNGRISVYSKNNKQSGAFAYYSNWFDPFVMLNWVGDRNDITTMVHELGHAFHGFLSKKQNTLQYHTPLCMAETASIFNETLFFESMIQTLEKEDRNFLIIKRLDDIFGTIFRQIMYTSFELRCHESFKDGEPLNYTDFNNIWLEEVKKLYGNDITFDDEYSSIWSSIPHFFNTPFYCYAYAFGCIVSLNLYENYKNATDKTEFIANYHKLLEAGGSDTPENLLYNIMNIRIDEKFYTDAFNSIKRLIEQIEF